QAKPSPQLSGLIEQISRQTPLMQRPPAAQSSTVEFSPGSARVQAPLISTVPSATHSTRPRNGSCETTSQVHFSPASQPDWVTGLHAPAGPPSPFPASGKVTPPSPSSSPPQARSPVAPMSMAVKASFFIAGAPLNFENDRCENRRFDHQSGAHSSGADSPPSTGMFSP